MPDRIDLSLMQSCIIDANGFRRLRRCWTAPGNDFWDDIWAGAGADKYWREGIAGRCLGSFGWLYLKYLKRGARVLEAGCGIGQVVLSLRHHGFDALGLDFAEQTIRRLESRFPECDFRLGDIRQLPYDAGEFDAYVSLGVIEHFVEGQREMMEEAARVLRPGGILFLSVPAFNRYRRLRARLGLYENCPTEPFFEDCYTETELALLLKHTGFELLESAYANPVMTFAQESFIRPLYRRIEDTRYVRSVVDCCLGLVLPARWFGHMMMVVGRKL